MGGAKEVSPRLSDEELFAKFSLVCPSSGAVVEDIREEVPESIVNKYFGPKSSKSGWKYQKLTTPEEAAAIYDLWTRVYDDIHVPNKEITLQFARGLILQQQEPVNWAEFAVSRHRYREVLRESKKSSSKLESCSERKPVDNGEISVLGKKRCLARSVGSGSDLPTTLKLSMKAQVSEELEVGKKWKGKGNKDSKCSEAVPNWIESEISDMHETIVITERLLSKSKKELEESRARTEELEGEVRRAKIMLSDRELMIEESKVQKTNLCEQEVLLQRRIFEKEEALSCGTSKDSLQLMALLVADKAEMEEVAVTRSLLEQTGAHSSSVILGCKRIISSAESRLAESIHCCCEVSARVLSVESLLSSMLEQKIRMSIGGGGSFFPRPVPNNPSKPISTNHDLNACPVCGFWYIQNNFIPLGCGHTYHQFCLLELIKNSTICCEVDCKEPLSSTSLAAIGIRPVAKSSLSNCVLKTEGNLPKPKLISG